MTPSSGNPWLHRLALVTAVATLGLIGIGGLVTSHEAGMAVPDWPTTYGYNMFFFPFSKWVGGVFYEHSHRLIASLVGLLTALLAGWIWARETSGWQRRVGLGAIVLTLGLMGVRTQGMFIALAVVALGVIAFSLTRLGPDPRPLRWLAAIAFAAVLVQGVLGGLRVTAMKDQLGILHGTLAQLFFTLICALALFTSPWWRESAAREKRSATSAGLGGLLRGTVLLILCQLMLGASMRHQHAGLAVPDFPLAYGTLWPATDAAALERINRARERTETRDFKPITAGQIGLHMMHRATALAILGAVAACAWRTRRELGGAALLSRLTAGWLGLIVVQASLGAWTVWSNKAADIATLHVVMGSLSLACGALLTVVAFRPAVCGSENAGVALSGPGASVRASRCESDLK